MSVLSYDINENDSPLHVFVVIMLANKNARQDKRIKETPLREDIYIAQILRKCEDLKKANLWLKEPKIRPLRWLNNFDDSDKVTAAFLLDKFVFYNEELTNILLSASYNSLTDGLSKGPDSRSAEELLLSLQTALFTPVRGEEPRPTDSGNLFCRKARQILRIPDDNLVESEEAIQHALAGNTVIFLDDFIGSGDQFLSTWKRNYRAHGNQSFMSIRNQRNFDAIYIAVVSTQSGLERINRAAPEVMISVSHILGAESTIFGLKTTPEKKLKINNLLKKYWSRLNPNEIYMRNHEKFLMHGYKEKGLLFGFEHSIPDATLPIFWSKGPNWEPLIERL